MGVDGQYIFVVPKLDLVAIFASNLKGADCYKPLRRTEPGIG